jgi:4-alpha-glucanotransferase
MDHFRGFVAYWEVGASETNAIHGNWVEVPALDFFDHLLKQFPGLPLIAEDLGYITPDVTEVMDHYQFPGMKLLIFAFGEDMPTNPYIPHNVEQNCVFYTGTHDNNTIRGWFETEATVEERNRVFQYMGRAVSADEIHWEMIRLVMMSAANTAIFPMQDVLGLGREARMNRPATTDGNWGWRLLPGQVTKDVTEKLAQMTETYGRA